MVETPVKVQKNIVDFAPPEWLLNGLGDATVIRGYRALLSPDQLPDFCPCILNLGLVQAIVIKAVVNYLYAGELSILQNEDGTFDGEIIPGGNRSTPSEWHLLLFSPCQWSDGDSEAVAWSRVDEATGLLVAANGMRAVYEHIFDNKAKVDNLQVSAIAQSRRSPQTLRKPLWNSQALQSIQGVASAIDALPLSRKGPLQVSLRWFSESFRASGVDIFLKRWIAIETLTLENTSNIKPLIKLLSQIYDGEEGRYPAGFGIGRIYGRRCRVVHEGEKGPALGLLLDYMESIYTDCLYGIAAVKSPRRVEEIFADEGPEISKMLAGL